MYVPPPRFAEEGFFFVAPEGPSKTPTFPGNVTLERPDWKVTARAEAPVATSHTNAHVGPSGPAAPPPHDGACTVATAIYHSHGEAVVPVVGTFGRPIPIARRDDYHRAIEPLLLWFDLSNPRPELPHL